MVKNISLFFVG